jgi:hypothetical protein
MYGTKPAGTQIPIVLKRDNATMTVQVPLRFGASQPTLVEDPAGLAACRAPTQRTPARDRGQIARHTTARRAASVARGPSCFRRNDRTQYCATLSIQVFGTMVYLAIDDVAFFTEQELYM